MFKKLLIIVLCALPFSVFAQAPLKFGNINSQEIFALMPEKIAAEKSLEAVSKKYEDEFMKMQEEYNKKYQDFVAQRDSLPQNIQARRMQEVAELEQRINNFREVALKDIQEQQQQQFAPVTKKLTDAIKAIGTENKFTYIFDLANPVVLYTGAPAEDVTSLVKAKLGLK